MGSSVYTKLGQEILRVSITMPCLCDMEAEKSEYSSHRTQEHDAESPADSSHWAWKGGAKPLASFPAHPTHTLSRLC